MIYNIRQNGVLACNFQNVFNSVVMYGNVFDVGDMLAKKDLKWRPISREGLFESGELFAD